jgi:hypothetical protein
MSRTITLTQGKAAIVDDVDYDRLAHLRWYADKVRNIWYARHARTGAERQRSFLMHRLILGAPAGMEVDHRNGDGLDNRRANLRLCTRAQNSWNRHALPRGASRFTGVCMSRLRWRARISCGNERTNIGDFSREVDAAIAYDEKCRELRGEFARPNFSLTLAERKLRDWVSRTGGRFFSICFIKRTDGSERVMHCRTGVAPLPGPSIIKITQSKDLLSVWDVQAREFRYVPLEGILWIRYKNTYIRPLWARRAALDATTQGLLFARTAG